MAVMVEELCLFVWRSDLVSADHNQTNSRIQDYDPNVHLAPLRLREVALTGLLVGAKET